MNNSVQDLLILENLLGIKFNDIKLLSEAVTHSSYVYQLNDLKHNERLEFLGDSVLQLCISEYLYKNFMEKTEGELTKLRSLIVCENSLYQIAVTLRLGEFIFMSKGEELTGGRERISILSDCVEAIIASIYLDKGTEEAKKFILEKFKVIIQQAIENKIILDYKTRLQEELQKSGEVCITYNLVKHEGPPHNRKFFMEVSVNNKAISQGAGYSKKEAEQNAAKEVLKIMEEGNGEV